MSNNNSENKKKILNIAQNLFYERGFNETSFAEIAKECTVTKAIIYSHFKSKLHLGGAVFGNYSREMANTYFKKVYEQFPLSKNEAIFNAYALLCIDFYKEEKNAFRFYEQFFSNSIIDTVVGVEDFYRFSGYSLPNDIRHMLYIGSNYAARALIYHYVTGDIKCDREIFEKYYLFNPFYFLSPEQGKLDELYNEAKFIYNEVTVEFLPNFKLK
jgi:AcrR family transcriptional regulator